MKPKSSKHVPWIEFDASEKKLVLEFAGSINLSQSLPMIYSFQYYPDKREACHYSLDFLLISNTFACHVVFFAQMCQCSQ